MRQNAKKSKLLEKILTCKDMLQGSIVRINSRCGKKGCKCETGQYHGVSYYLSYRDSGRTQMVYIPKHLVAEVQKRTEDFKRYWQLGVELSKVNLKELKGRKR
jgi:hypothetical protein